MFNKRDQYEQWEEDRIRAGVYCPEQNLHLQLDALHKAGCDQVYEEKMSGKNAADRPELAHCLKALRGGDTLVVWRLDRLGRSLPDLVNIISSLEQQGIAFESLMEKIDTQQRNRQADLPRLCLFGRI